jgi:predicted dehydrogenase
MSHSEKGSEKSPKGPKVRYAVVGAGWITQAAVLPSFQHAKSSSELVAIVSGDGEKRRALGKRYGVKTYSYEQYDECLKSGDVDAVYIALPNHLHYEYTVRAAQHRVHVLCEKPMAVSSEQCRDMIQACRVNRVKLMVAYRLHFHEAHVKAIELIRSGTIGEPRYFVSAFSAPIVEGNIRLRRETGGGPLLDLGIYCINAASYLFGETPLEVVAMGDKGEDPRFSEVDETVSAILRFPKGKTAAFTCSFGGANESSCEIIGTKGSLCLNPAFDFETELTHYLTIDDKTQTKKFPKSDQFAPELDYFSTCVLNGKDPEPSGVEGLNDILIMEAIQASLEQGIRIKLKGLGKEQQPAPSQVEKAPAVEPAPLVNAQSPEAA